LIRKEVKFLYLFFIEKANFTARIIDILFKKVINFPTALLTRFKINFDGRFTFKFHPYSF